MAPTSNRPEGLRGFAVGALTAIAIGVVGGAVLFVLDAVEPIPIIVMAIVAAVLSTMLVNAHHRRAAGRDSGG